jgi:hypothetical protein
MYYYLLLWMPFYYYNVQICMFSYILQVICLSACFFNINAISIYIDIIDPFGTLRSRGFFENDTLDAPLPKNALASLCALETLYGTSTIYRTIFITKMTVRSGPFSELESACPSEISNHFSNWKGTAHPGPFFELKNDCP